MNCSRWFWAIAASAAALTISPAQSVAMPAASFQTQVWPPQNSAASPWWFQIGANAVPAPCVGQTTTSTHSTLKEKLLTSGGKLCIPAFGGFGGSISYPGANPSVDITLISSTTNYNHKLPALHSGSPVFYLQLATSGATQFGTNTPAGGGLTGKLIKAGAAYTVYGQATIFGFTVDFKPCYTIATRGPFGGVIGGIGTLLKGQNVPAAASGVIEIYPGQSASGHC